MDWEQAIEINRAALRRVMVQLFALLELALEGPLRLLPRPIHIEAERLLTPAESALRRLIIMAARGLKVSLGPARPMPQGLVIAGGGAGRASFPLFDPRKRFSPGAPDRDSLDRGGSAGGPRIHFFGTGLLAPGVPQHPSSTPASSLDAGALCRRYAAFKYALETLPRQARRLARWRLRRAALQNPKFTSPLRPGAPPGQRQKPRLEIDHVLKECHGLAFDLLREESS